MCFKGSFLSVNFFIENINNLDAAQLSLRITGASEESRS